MEEAACETISMSFESLRTLVVDSEERAAGVTAAFACMGGRHQAVAGVDQARECLGEVDLLLSPSFRCELHDLAEQAGLIVPVIFSFQELVYYGRVRFGIHKWAYRLLAKTGQMWELRPGGDEAPDRYRKLLNRVADGIVEVDAQDTICWANATLRQALGEQIVGAKLEKAVDSGDRVRLRTLRHQHLAGVVVPFPIRLRTGQLVEVDPSPRFGSDGTQLGASIVFRGLGKEEGQTDRAKELFALYSIATAISECTGLEQTLKKVVRLTMELLELSAAGVFLGEKLEVCRGHQVDSELEEHLRVACAAMGPEKKASVFRQLPDNHPLSESGWCGFAAVPMRNQEETIGYLWFASGEGGGFSRETVSLLISIASQVTTVVENLGYMEQQLQAESERRRFYRDALCAVTQGKLALCERSELDEVWADSGRLLGHHDVRETADVPKVRRLVESSLSEEGLPEEKVADLALCVTEAVGNVVKHADRGRVEICGNEDLIRVRVDDNGPGIDFAQLPSAVLTAGYSTAPSLGMGYSILLEMLDRLHLTTGEGGTSLILEMQKKVADPLDAFIGFLSED